MNQDQFFVCSRIEGRVSVGGSVHERLSSAGVTGAALGSREFPQNEERGKSGVATGHHGARVERATRGSAIRVNACWGNRRNMGQHGGDRSCLTGVLPTREVQAETWSSWGRARHGHVAIGVRCHLDRCSRLSSLPATRPEDRHFSSMGEE